MDLFLTRLTILPYSAHAAILAVQSDAENYAVISAADFWVLAAVELADAPSAQEMDGSSSASATGVMQSAEVLTLDKADGSRSTVASGAEHPAKASPARSAPGSSSRVMEVPLQPSLHLNGAACQYRC